MPWATAAEAEFYGAGQGMGNPGHPILMDCGGCDDAHGEALLTKVHGADVTKCHACRKSTHQDRMGYYAYTAYMYAVYLGHFL